MKQTDGRAITNPENAQSFSHAEIKMAADEMNPDGLDAAFDAWSAISAAVTKAGEQFETAINRTVELHWEGAAADRAVLGIRDYAARVGELGDSLHAQSEPLSAATGAATRFKAAVPEVADSSGTDPRGPKGRNTEEEQARDDMNTHYIQPFGTTAPAIPTLPPPVGPVAELQGIIGATATGEDPGTPKPTADESESAESGAPIEPLEEGAAPQNQADEGAAPQNQAERGSTTTPEQEPNVTAPQPISQHSGNVAPTGPSMTNTTAPTPTAPATPTAAQLTTPVPSTMAPTSVNGTVIRPDAPSDSPGSTSTPGREPSPGTSRPAQPGSTPAASGPQPPGPHGRPGVPGATGYGGMMPPRVYSRREDDDEHASPTYLRTEEHAKELLGEVEPTVPPVLGAD